MIKCVRGLFHRENTLKEASSILILTLAISNLLGVVRDHFLAQKIPTDRLDIYYAAFRLPDLLFNVVILGAISAAFIPVFTTLWHEDEKRAWRLANSVLSVGLAIVLVGLILMAIFMPFLMAKVVPDFGPAKLAETVKLARILLISPFFFGLSYFVGSILNSFKRFFVSSLAPLVYNLAIILSTVLLADRFGVQAVVWGVIVGAILHFGIQVSAASKAGFKFRFNFDYKDINVRRVGRLMIPRAIGLGGNQIMLIVFTAIASAFPGAIAIFNLADNIQTVPTVVFGLSLGTAVFPTLSHFAAQNKMVEFRDTLSKTFLAITFFTIPATIFLLLLRAQIVRLILGYGFFNWNDTVLTIDTLTYFSLGIVAQSLVPLLARGFYAKHNTKLPTVISLISIAISIFSALYFGEKYGVPGLALASTFGGFTSLLLLLIFAVRERIVALDVDFWLRLAKITTASLIAGLTIQLTKKTLESVLSLDIVSQLALQACLSLAAGIVVFVVLAWLLRLPEVQHQIFARFWRGFIIKPPAAKE